MQYVYSHQYLCISIDSVMLTLKYPSVQSPQSIYIYICPTLLLCFTYLLLIFNACESEIRSTYNMQHTHRTQHKSQSKCFAKLSHTFSRNARADRMLCACRFDMFRDLPMIERKFTQKRGIHNHNTVCCVVNVAK